MKKKRKRGLAWLMTLAMIVTMLPMTAWANLSPPMIEEPDLSEVSHLKLALYKDAGLTQKVEIEIEGENRVSIYGEEEPQELDIEDIRKFFESPFEHEGVTYELVGFRRAYDNDVNVVTSLYIPGIKDDDFEEWVTKWGDGIEIICLPEGVSLGGSSKKSVDYYNITSTIETDDGHKPLGKITMTDGEDTVTNSNLTLDAVGKLTGVREGREVTLNLEQYAGEHEYVFLGWQIDDKIVSEDMEYSFKPTKDTKVYAYFEESDSAVSSDAGRELDVSGGDYVYADDRFYLFEDDTDYTVTMVKGVKVATTDTLEVFDGVERAHITLEDVKMSQRGGACLFIDDTTVDLVLKGENSLETTEKWSIYNTEEDSLQFRLDAEEPGSLTLKAEKDSVLYTNGKLLHDGMRVRTGNDEASAKLIAAAANQTFDGEYGWMKIEGIQQYEYFDFNNAEDKFFSDEEQLAATKAAADYNMAMVKYNSFFTENMTYVDRLRLNYNSLFKDTEKAYLEAKAEYEKHLTNSSGELFEWYEKRMEELGTYEAGKLNELKDFAETKWGGSCFGFSAVAAMFHLEEMSLGELNLFDEDAADLPDTTMPKEDTDVRDLLNYYLVLQKLPEVRGQMRDMDEKDDQQNLLQLAQRLAQATEEGRDDPVMFLYFFEENGATYGHAVTLDGAVKNSDGSYTVLVEDNRFFGQELVTDVVRNSNGGVVDYTLTGQDINPTLEISRDGKKAAITFEGGWTTNDGNTFKKYGAFDEKLKKYEVITNYEMLKDYFPGEYAEPEENTAPANPIYTVKPGIPIIWFDDDDYGVIDPRWTIPWSPILPGDGNDGEMNPIEAIPVDKLPVDALPGDGDDGDDQMNPIDAAPADGWYIEGMKWAYDNIEQKRNLIAGAAVSTDDDMNVVMEYAPASVMAEVKPRDQYAVVNPDGEITGKVSYAEGDLYSKADTEKADAAVFGAEGDAALVGNEGEFEITVTRKNGDELVSVFGHADGDVAARPTAEGIELIAPAGIYTVTFEGDTEKMVTVASEGGKVSVSEDGAVEVPEVVPVTPESELPFTDVKATDWFYNAVKYVYENGLMSGTSETTFSPAATTSRGMITSILWRMEGRPYAENALPFTDVKADAYYAEAIAWAAEEGIVSGYGDTFGPDDNITREQLASILWRYAKYKGYDVSVGEDTNILSYTDAFDISEYAIPAMQWACGDGIISGNDDGTLNPKGHAQRSHAAQMLMKFMKNTVE